MRKCPLCGKKKNSPFRSFAETPLLRCSNCTLVFLKEKPKEKNIQKIYEENYFKTKNTSPKGYFDYEGLLVELKKEANKKLKFIKRYSSKKRLLDVGAGTGRFLKEAKKQGYMIYGNDISSYACGYLKKEGIKTFEGRLEDNVLPKNFFDIVTGWDVIEHVIDPVKAIRSIASSLKTGGYLFITTPSLASIDARIMGRRWYNYKKAPEHTLFFDRESMRLLLEKGGFKLVKITPWGFYRSVDFVLGRIFSSYKFFSFADQLIPVKLKKKVLYFPFTDMMIVAQKL